MCASDGDYWGAPPPIPPPARGQLCARSLFAPEQTYWEATHTLVLLTNELPRGKADNAALWARMHVLPFKYSFVSAPDPKDPLPAEGRPGPDRQAVGRGPGGAGLAGPGEGKPGVIKRYLEYFYLIHFR